VQPVLEELDGDLEEAAAILGANRFQTFIHVIMPSILPALITGFSLAFARGLGEYGSIVFVSSNLPYRSETGPVLIVSRLEENAINDASAAAIVMLMASFGMLLLINTLQKRRQSNG
jgi:sulfate transport system permease protein